MDFFEYHNGVLHAESVDLRDVAERFGTPAYVYSRATLERHWHAFDRALAGHDHLVCYSVKANSNLGVLDVLAALGSGFDIVSEGELERVLAVTGSADNVVFSGVGKTRREIDRGLAAGVRCFNVESAEELERIEQCAAARGVVAPIALRVNPDVDARTHPYISTGLRQNKFGIPIEQAAALYRHADGLPHVEVTGVDCHIGSQQTSLAPFEDSLERLLALVDALAGQGIRLHHINLGGGLGIRYRDEQPPTPDEYVRAMGARIRDRGLTLLIEPGRAIAGNAGVLLTRVEYLKANAERRFAIVDAAMNDLLRPALYHAWQEILPVVDAVEGADAEACPLDVVGPVCESSDFLGKQRCLAVAPGDLLAVRGAGAYGFVMSGNYNSRPRPPEILIDGALAHEVRSRETVAELFARESRLPKRAGAGLQ